MRVRTLLLLVILAAVAVFAALNWTAFSTPASLHLLVARVEAPLGVILLAVIAGLTLIYILFLAWVETSSLLEVRRYAREAHAQRQLAESAEASRYAELRTYLERELEALGGQPAAAGRDVIARVDQVAAELRAEVERTGNTLAAYVGELEERLERGDRPAPPAPPAGR